jgi:hypothetical protein
MTASDSGTSSWLCQLGGLPEDFGHLMSDLCGSRVFSAKSPNSPEAEMIVSAYKNPWHQGQDYPPAFPAARTIGEPSTWR